MKFSCERCGKRYATAKEPTPGRVFRITCKACGHLIVVAAEVAPVVAAAAPQGTSTPAPVWGHSDSVGVPSSASAPGAHRVARVASADGPAISAAAAAKPSAGRAPQPAKPPAVAKILPLRSRVVIVVIGLGLAAAAGLLAFLSR